MLTMHSSLSAMQNNAYPHVLFKTMGVMKERMIIPIYVPLYSLDLIFIETFWEKTKYFIQYKYLSLSSGR